MSNFVQYNKDDIVVFKRELNDYQRHLWEVFTQGIHFVYPWCTTCEQEIF
jgi:hypothetical protein